MMQEDLKLFIDDIKNEKFKEAHERLEPKWKEYKKSRAHT